MKKILSILLSAVIILSGFTFAFADDPEEEIDSSSGSSAYTLEEQSFIDQADSDTDRDLRTLSVEVVRSTSSTYSLDDIYNLLLSVYTTYTGRASWAVFDQSVYNLIVNNFSHYDSVSGNTYDVGAMLWIVEQCLIELSNTLVPATAASQPSIYNLIDSINETLSLALVDANNTPYLVNIYNKLVDIDSGFIDYTSALFYNSIGVAEYASRINSAIVASYNGLHTQLSKLDTTNDKLTTINTSLQIKLTALNTHAQTIEGKIDNQTNTISNDLSSSGAIASSLDNINNNLNNITFSNAIINFYGYKTNKDLSSPYIPTNINIDSSSIYSFFKFDTINTNEVILKFSIPSRFALFSLGRNVISKLYLIANNTFYDYSPNDVFYKYSGKYLNIYMLFNTNFFINNFDYCLEVLFSDNVTTYQNYNFSCEYISSNNIDYYTVVDYLLKTDNFNSIKKFVDIYASDDLIAAKENQQSYEDQVVSDFTGSGSAAAKASDASSAKDISSAVSSGLNSGGSVNNSLNVFNPSGGFWGWFSQENSDLINTLSSNNRLRSSISGSDWVIDDPYQRNAEELQSILGGDK